MLVVIIPTLISSLGITAGVAVLKGREVGHTFYQLLSIKALLMEWNTEVTI